jgi:hypothetical protein
VAQDSKSKNHINNQANSLEEMKRYFRIEDPDDHHQFEKYLKKNKQLVTINLGKTSRSGNDWNNML